MIIPPPRRASGEHPRRRSFYIPDEPVLRGAVPLFQWVAVTATGEVAVSDVFGAMITRPWPERSTDYGDGTDAKRSSAATLREAALGPEANPEAARKRFEEIVRSRPRCAITGAKLELLRRMAELR